ncbi:TetR/AcrR family transcriptional regulator C-terminal ligand-binding domain-containing protein [Streptomyces sp. NPDC089919]|uniref:TetR/AcrR family transcriptional regulator n=1 Tax=Streptomyces sp. NPDC089919 TaxID=3155188 RepID=UPI003426D389
MPVLSEREPHPRARRGRGRRPAAEVRADVLAAANALLLSEGMGGFTIEGVADGAGVSKTTIYKWWSSKGALALDGYLSAAPCTPAFPDSGDIAADLTAQLGAFVRQVTGTAVGRVLVELVGQAQTDPALCEAFLERYTGPRRRLAAEAVRRAQGRGQLRLDADPEAIVDQLWGACYYRLLLPHGPLTEDFAAALVKDLLRGVRA